MLVHFPIALVIVGFLADVTLLIYKKELWLSKAGFFLLVAGTISALFTLISGALFTSEMSGAAGEVKEKHELLAWITVGLLFATILFRIIILKRTESARLKLTAFILYGIAAVAVSVTGFFGGTLVYNYMMPL
jgi:uncharacterized membrane protein